MTAFIRRYESNPGLDVLTEIEGVVILDQEPTSQVAGTGSRPVLLVGEFEDGPFNTPTEVFGEADQFSQFGEFGFVYDGVPASNPCARARKADGAINNEYWNGNGFLWLSRKRFRRLFLCRVDTSAGEVSFTRLASISGSDSPTFDLEPGQTLVVSVNGGADLTATFDAAAAVKVSGAGTYPSTFTGGESITFKIDGVQYTAVFLAADQTQAAVIARMNAACGFTAFTDAGPAAADTTLTGRIRGTAGSVQIVSVSAALVTTATGFSAGAATAGTGDVANIDAVTLAEVNTVVTADITGAKVDRDHLGRIRIYNSGTPGTGTLLIQDTSTATAFGFPTETLASAATGVDGFIPAGTRVRTAGGIEFVTMQTVAVTASAISGVTPSGAGPYTVKVRHGLDDTTGLTAAVAAVNTLPFPVSSGAWSVTNNLSVSAALTEAQIDARYITAIDNTKAITTTVREVNVICSARQSNAIRAALGSNARDASANGCRGRVAVIRTPMGTTRAIARSSSPPGVGTYRSDRVWYAYPNVRQYISRIAARGLAGGAGFTADGVINVGFDAAVASLSSVLNPEENIGQLTEHLDWIVGLESGNTDIANLNIEDYKALRRAGIMAPNLLGIPEIQSAVTSVDPTLQPARKNANRRAFTDYILDSLAEFARPFQKRLNTPTRRAQFVGSLKGFTADLVRQERALRDVIDGVSGNTEAQLARGVYWVKVTVQMVPTMEVIVIDGQIGESVTFAEAA